MHTKFSTEKSKRNYFTISEVAEEIGCSRSSATKYIQKLNKELEEKGFFVVAGRVPKHYFYERFNIAEQGLEDDQSED